MYAWAVDLGTTNVEVTWVKGAGGSAYDEVLPSGSAIALNEQTVWGLEVLSRLAASLVGEEERIALRNAAQTSVLTAAREAAQSAGLVFEDCLAEVRQVVVAANSVMAALFTGQDASSLATAPFVPVENLPLTEGPLRDLLPTTATIEVLEPLSHFVGGDIRSALVGVGMTQGNDDCVQVLIDLGTNAELVLHSGDSFWVTSAAAGPAFSGNGQRIAPSLLLADLASLLREGVISSAGLLNKNHPACEVAESGVAFARATSGLAISQLLIRELQMAKAALDVALSSLMEAAGVCRLDRLFLAGAFGEALRTEDITTLGFFSTVETGEILSVGNAAVEGLIRYLLQDASLDLGATIHAVDLTALPDFQTRLMTATSFS